MATVVVTVEVEPSAEVAVVVVVVVDMAVLAEKWKGEWLVAQQFSTVVLRYGHVHYVNYSTNSFSRRRTQRVTVATMDGLDGQHHDRQHVNHGDHSLDGHVDRQVDCFY